VLIDISRFVAGWNWRPRGFGIKIVSLVLLALFAGDEVEAIYGGDHGQWRAT
jgi:hypothetical protein